MKPSTKWLEQYKKLGYVIQKPPFSFAFEKLFSYLNENKLPFFLIRKHWIKKYFQVEIDLRFTNKIISLVHFNHLLDQYGRMVELAFLQAKDETELVLFVDNVDKTKIYKRVIFLFNKEETALAYIQFMLTEYKKNDTLFFFNELKESKELETPKTNTEVIEKGN